MKYRRVLVGLVITLGLLAVNVASSPLTTRAQNAGRPNIIFILTDDLDVESLNHLPKLSSLLTEQGTTFANFFVSLALCCPSRATILRGQYGHNTEILTNNAPGGGFAKFRDLGHETSTVATWLQDAGYRTVLLGKYLNGYPAGDPTHVPPGWSEWYGLLGAAFFNYRLNENGQVVQYGSSPEDYLTDVLAAKGSDFIQRAASAGTPFFMYLAPYAPHGPATAAPRHEDTFPDVRAPRTPSFNEDDISDKPTWVQNLAPLTIQQIAQLDRSYRNRLRSMLAIEDMIETLIQTLAQTGQLPNTYLFFTSDNGFHLGQHRQRAGKNSAYEEDIRVPLIVRGPHVPAGAVVEELAVNIDLAPTLARLAGVAVPAFVDGRSLVRLLLGEPVKIWRQAFLLEAGHLSGPRLFQGLRTTKYTYVEYPQTGDRELYDLEADPDQLQSLHDTADETLLAQLAAWLDSLRACRGRGCRVAEKAPPCQGEECRGLARVRR